MAKLKKGAKAPAFRLSDQDGNKRGLTDFKGQKLLVYFYPRADTPGCTTQSCSVSAARPEFKKLGLDVVGISPDAPERQKRFDEKHGLGFPLLSDPDHAVADRYGVWGEKTFMGRKSVGIIRSAFLVNEKGILLGAWYKISPKNTVPEAMKALDRAAGEASA